MLERTILFTFSLSLMCAFSSLCVHFSAQADCVRRSNCLTYLVRADSCDHAHELEFGSRAMNHFSLLSTRDSACLARLFSIVARRTSARAVWAVVAWRRSSTG